MANEEATGVKLETWLLIGFVVAMLLSTTVIVATSAGKETVFSAYVTDGDANIQYQQISSMRSDLGEGEE
ncbi:MAG: hypothetical protein OR994_09000, partial [Candidatus Poseidoniales archaeon]|nr:hypothetical protein [Candidatus Poseidoniales archaeon]